MKKPGRPPKGIVAKQHKTCRIDPTLIAAVEKDHDSFSKGLEEILRAHFLGTSINVAAPTDDDLLICNL